MTGEAGRGGRRLAAEVAPADALFAFFDLVLDQSPVKNAFAAALLVLSAAPGSPAQDGLRVLGALRGDGHPTVHGLPVTSVS